MPWFRGFYLGVGIYLCRFGIQSFRICQSHLRNAPELKVEGSKVESSGNLQPSNLQHPLALLRGSAFGVVLGIVTPTLRWPGPAIWRAMSPRLLRVVLRVRRLEYLRPHLKSQISTQSHKEVTKTQMNITMPVCLCVFVTSLLLCVENVVGKSNDVGRK